MEQKHTVAPGEASEALRDPWRIVLDPNPSIQSGQGIRVVGETATGRLLTDNVMRVEEITYGVNGRDSNDRDTRLYQDPNEGKKP